MYHESTDISSSTQPSTSQEHLTWIPCEGETVRVELNESVAFKLQEELIGWHDDLKNVNNATCFMLMFNVAPVVVNM